MAELEPLGAGPLEPETGDDVRLATLREDIRAPHNPRQQLITAAEAEQRTATELVAAAGSNVPALVAAVQTIAMRFEQVADNTDKLNRAVGEFRDGVVLPLKDELRGLKYTLADSAGNSVSQLHALVAQFDKRLDLVLTMLGKTDGEKAAIRAAAGIAADMPTLAELEAEGAPAALSETMRAIESASTQQIVTLTDKLRLKDAEVERLQAQLKRARKAKARRRA